MTPLRFDNALIDTLPGDPEPRVFPRQVQGALWSAVEPTPVAAPRLLAHSREVAAELGFSDADVASPEFAQVFAGNALLPGMQPFATNYGGHQFGHWAGQLGDGRAISLGEAVLPDGQRRELQLKGAGPRARRLRPARSRGRRRAARPIARTGARRNCWRTAACPAAARCRRTRERIPGTRRLRR